MTFKTTLIGTVVHGFELKITCLYDLIRLFGDKIYCNILQFSAIIKVSIYLL